MSAFFSRNFAAILAGAVGFAGTLVTAGIFIVGYFANKNAAELATKKDLREFVAAHRSELFGEDRAAAEQLRRTLEVTFPPEVVSDLLVRILPQAPAETRDIFNPLPKEGTVIEGKVETPFGGPADFSLAPDEGLSLFSKEDLPAFKEYFLPVQPSGTTGLARRLNPDSLYMAARWDYASFSKEFLQTHKVIVSNPKNGKQVEAQPVDWGPNPATDRAVSVSAGVARALGISIDDVVIVTIPKD